MNIDIVNKQVADKLKIKESKIKLINQYYWRQVYRHLYDFNPLPVNIENVCVLFPNKQLVKKSINFYIRKLRYIRKSRKFIHGSKKHLTYIERYTTLLRGFLKIRKQNKFTN